MRVLISLSILTAMFWAQPARPAPEDLLQAVGSIPLQKVSGRIDHFGASATSADISSVRLGPALTWQWKHDWLQR